MASNNFSNITVVTATSTTATVPAGFRGASFTNTGEADGTLTQNSNVVTLIAGGVFVLPYINSNTCWNEVLITATSTTIECAYF
jgi:hypothetical protein